MTEAETRFNTFLKSLDLIGCELGSKGLGEDPAWLEDYVYRPQEVAQGLHETALSQLEKNSSHNVLP